MVCIQLVWCVISDGIYQAVLDPDSFIITFCIWVEVEALPLILLEFGLHVQARKCSAKAVWLHITVLLVYLHDSTAFGSSPCPAISYTCLK